MGGVCVGKDKQKPPTEGQEPTTPTMQIREIASREHLNAVEQVMRHEVTGKPSHVSVAEVSDPAQKDHSPAAATQSPYSPKYVSAWGKSTLSPRSSQVAQLSQFSSMAPLIPPMATPATPIRPPAAPAPASHVSQPNSIYSHRVFINVPALQPQEEWADGYKHARRMYYPPK